MVAAQDASRCSELLEEARMALQFDDSDGTSLEALIGAMSADLFRSTEDSSICPLISDFACSSLRTSKVIIGGSIGAIRSKLTEEICLAEMIDKTVRSHGKCQQTDSDHCSKALNSSLANLHKSSSERIAILNLISDFSLRESLRAKVFVDSDSERYYSIYIDLAKRIEGLKR